MSSVLAIVSKALFEKMVPKSVQLGAVVDTNQYMSSHKTFDGLQHGGSIFLVTVRPPDEKLWLVGILENPKKKADTWTAAANEAPLTDITSALKKLKFESGAGITAKKGALGMSLQTPRALTDDDVELLRGLVGGKPASGGKVHANEAYMKAVDEVVHHRHKGRKQPAKTGALRLENRRKPFDGALADLAAWEQAQLERATGKKLGALFATKAEGGDVGDLGALEIADVVADGDRVVYQLLIWPFGDGCVMKNQSTEIVADICQHSLDPNDGVAKGFLRDMAAAWTEGSKRLGMWSGHIDFDEDELEEDEEDDDD